MLTGSGDTDIALTTLLTGQISSVKMKELSGREKVWMFGALGWEDLRKLHENILLAKRNG